VHGVAESSAAITVVNALPTGVGAAAGIELRARVEVELHPAGSSGKWDVRIPEDARTPLVVASLTEALRRFAPGSAGKGELSIRSEIPEARGLKSSSAVSSAIVLAVARATDSEISSIDVARLSASASVEAGVSATGAFDDALAGLSTGVVVTDNRRRELLASLEIPTDLKVAVFIPRGTHRPSPEWAEVFAAEAASGHTAADAALRGDWKEAMRENTALVERVMRYDYGALRTELHNCGAVACGVSGMGPALVAVAPHQRVDEVSAAFPSTAERTLILDFVRNSASSARRLT
jgi:shikimate kinase